MILDETRERFIKAILKQVDPARIAEIHFFAPIRQGGVESGVAVIAATERAPEPVADQSRVDAVTEVEELAQDAPLDAQIEEPAEDVAVEAPVEDADVASAHGAPSEAPPPQEDVVVVAPIERHVIYTARYRLTLKGPDRGKWEANVTAEADAPIITVDAVVRGVQRRSGDVDDPTRMTGDDVRAAIPAGV